MCGIVVVCSLCMVRVLRCVCVLCCAVGFVVRLCFGVCVVVVRDCRCAFVLVM